MSGIFQCNSGPIRTLAATATTTSEPLEPFPIFFTDATNCNSGRASLSDGGVFPSLALPNTMFIEDGDIRNSNYTLSGVNVLDAKDDATSSSIIGSSGNLLSLYVPPNYRVYFFSSDPRHTPVSQCLQEAHANIPPQTTFPSLFDVELTNGSKLLIARDSRNRVITDPDSGAVVHSVKYNAPYVVVCRLESYEDIVRDMCTLNRQVNIGDTTLNDVWTAQTKECDSFMLGYCRSSKTSGDRSCNCFIQQARLNSKYGPEAGVPVTCFGSDVTQGDELPCAQDNKAYKTFEMIQNNCTLPVCQKVVNGSVILQQAAADAGIGSIKCEQQVVQIPKPKSPNEVTGHMGEVNNTTDPQVVYAARTEITTTSIPTWVWGILGGGVFLFIVFLFVYARSTLGQSSQSSDSFDDSDTPEINTDV